MLNLGWLTKKDEGKKSTTLYSSGFPPQLAAEQQTQEHPPVSWRILSLCLCPHPLHLSFHLIQLCIVAFRYAGQSK